MLCNYRLNRWYNFIAKEFSVEEVEHVEAVHIKNYIRHCQTLGKEKPLTINGSIATLRVFFNGLVEEEFIEEVKHPMRHIKNLTIPPMLLWKGVSCTMVWWMRNIRSFENFLCTI